MGYAIPGTGLSPRMRAVAVAADTVLDSSHLNKIVEVTCGAVDRTLTLPGAANDGDEIVVLKADRTVGRVLFASLAGTVGLPWLFDQDDMVRLHYSVSLGWLPFQTSDGYRYRSGLFYGGDEIATGAATNGSAGWLMYTPILIHKRATFAGMGCNITTAGAAATTVQLGLYSSKAGAPDSLLAQTPFASGLIPGDVLGDQYADFVGGNLTLCPALYWRAVGVSSSAIAMTGVASGGLKGLMSSQMGNANSSGVFTSNTGFFSTTGFTAGTSLPATASGSLTGRGTTSAPTATLKAA